jgi:hypothetical protein
VRLGVEGCDLLELVVLMGGGDRVAARSVRVGSSRVCTFLVMFIFDICIRDGRYETNWARVVGLGGHCGELC